MEERTLIHIGHPKLFALFNIPEITLVKRASRFVIPSHPHFVEYLRLLLPEPNRPNHCCRKLIVVLSVEVCRCWIFARVIQ